jgi:hypothetical protein
MYCLHSFVFIFVCLFICLNCIKIFLDGKWKGGGWSFVKYSGTQSNLLYHVYKCTVCLKRSSECLLFPSLRNKCYYNNTDGDSSSYGGMHIYGIIAGAGYCHVTVKEDHFNYGSIQIKQCSGILLIFR